MQQEKAQQLDRQEPPSIANSPTIAVDGAESQANTLETTKNACDVPVTSVLPLHHNHMISASEASTTTASPKPAAPRVSQLHDKRNQERREQSNQLTQLFNELPKRYRLHCGGLRLGTIKKSETIKSAREYIRELKDEVEWLRSEIEEKEAEYEGEATAPSVTRKSIHSRQAQGNIPGREWGDPRNDSGLVAEGGLSREDVGNKWKKSLEDMGKQVPAQKIFFLQISDAYRMDAPIKNKADENGLRPGGKWSHDHRPLPYDGGYLPVEDFTKAVLHTGFRGWLSMEIFDGKGSEKYTDDTNPYAKQAMSSLNRLLKACDGAGK